MKLTTAEMIQSLRRSNPAAQIDEEHVGRAVAGTDSITLREALAKSAWDAAAIREIAQSLELEVPEECGVPAPRSDRRRPGRRSTKRPSRHQQSEPEATEVEVLGDRMLPESFWVGSRALLMRILTAHAAVVDCVRSLPTRAPEEDEADVGLSGDLAQNDESSEDDEARAKSRRLLADIMRQVEEADIFFDRETRELASSCAQDEIFRQIMLNDQETLCVLQALAKQTTSEQLVTRQDVEFNVARFRGLRWRNFATAEEVEELRWSGPALDPEAATPESMRAVPGLSSLALALSLSDFPKDEAIDRDLQVYLDGFLDGALSPQRDDLH